MLISRKLSENPLRKLIGPSIVAHMRPIPAYGRYDILESEGDKIILDLFHINGKLNSERVQIRVNIDREADTIKLLRAGPFTRMLP
jgi:hypothetical protein